LNIIVKTLFTIVIVLALLFSVSKLYDFALKYNVNLKTSYIQKGQINADILIHGPCEPLWMISPEILDKQTGLKSYNLALSHSDFADNYLHLYLYLKNNRAPKYLFLYVTPESMDTVYNTFNAYRFSAFLEDDTVNNVIKECDANYYKWIQIPFMRHAYYNNKINFNVAQGLKHYFSNRSIPHFADGYEPPFQVKWDNHLEKFIKLYPDGYNFKWNKLREKYLRKIIELAQAKNIEIYLYESPVLKEALQYQPNRNEMIEKIKFIANDYNIQYLQFNDMKIAESREYYMSTLNTNLKGSAIFTDSLGKYIYNQIVNK